MKAQTLLFDLDDTLIHCNKYFIAVLDRFVEQMKILFAGHALQADDIKRKQAELDLAGIERHGFVKGRFPESLVETYRHFAKHVDKPAREDEERLLYQLGHTVYEQQFEPLPDMRDTLDRLRDHGHSLCLYTGGDRQVQSAKVKQLGLERYFGDRIFITPHKTTDAMRAVLERLRPPLMHTWMIGNSARTDIVPALENGINAIYIPSPLEWSYNVVPIEETDRVTFLQAESLKDVPELIVKAVSP